MLADSRGNSLADNSKPPLLIPAEALSVDALRGVIDSFIQREGTDYGTKEISYDSKIDQVQRQIAKGTVKIVFDPNLESVSLMTDLEWFSVSKRISI